MLLLAGIAVVALTGCELKDDGDNLVNGKTLFVQECSAVPHARARRRARASSGRTSTRRGSRRRRTASAARPTRASCTARSCSPTAAPQNDPITGKPLPLMPANLVTGEDAQDVAAYVAYAAAAPGEDPGRLADAGGGEARGDRQGRGRHARDPGRGPGSRTSSRTPRPPPARSRSSRSTTSRPTHNIAVDGDGVDEKGDVVHGRRHVDGRGRPRAGRVRVLLLRARPPRGRHGGQAHGQVARARLGRAPPRAARRSAASSRSCCCAACQKKNASAKTMIRMSSATIIAPAVCWSASAPIPRRSPLAVDAACRPARGSARTPSRGTSRPSAPR